MGNKLNKALILLGSSEGRWTFGRELLNRCYPLLRPIAAVYRRTVLRKIRIISVIGSLGKSTTCKAVAAVVGDSRLRGFSNTKTMIIKNLLKYRPSSPYAVLETGITGPGEMAGYASMLKPNLVVVTSIASEHILSFKSLGNARDEKSKMLAQLPPKATAILNGDDPNVMWMAPRTDAKILTFGINENSDVRAKNVKIDPPDGMKFDVQFRNETFSLRISLLGRHMVYPVLAALAVALAEGLSIPESSEKLRQIKPIEARMHSSVLPSGAVLIRDDYKATRESVWRALETLAEYPAERKYLVLGGVSEIFNKERYSFFRDLGSKISQSADYGYVRLDKNSFRRCLAAAAAGGMDRKRLTRIKFDPLSIISLLPDNLGKGDVILIKGRPDYKISRLSLALMGKHVGCRKMSCPVSTSYCDNCSTLSGR